MLKVVLVGIWIVTVTAGAALLSAKYLDGESVDTIAERERSTPVAVRSTRRGRCRVGGCAVVRAKRRCP